MTDGEDELREATVASARRELGLEDDKQPVGYTLVSESYVNGIMDRLDDVSLSDSLGERLSFEKILVI